MLVCTKLGVTLSNNKINCIYVVIFQVNFLLNLLFRAISDMLEHLCLKYISVNYEDMTITVNHSVSKPKMFLLIFKLNWC